MSTCGHIPSLHSSSLSDSGLKPQKHIFNWFHTYTPLQVNFMWPRLRIPLLLVVSFIYPLWGKWLQSQRGLGFLLFCHFFSSVRPTQVNARNAYSQKSHSFFWWACGVMRFGGLGGPSLYGMPAGEIWILSKLMKSLILILNIPGVLKC